ncbi:class I SAM-dependent methyltransferase [Candidatus Bipolaricaulota bacterium]
MTNASRDPVRSAWEQNAKWWSDRFGEGNNFHLQLVAPSVEKLLAIQPGEQVLDIACGNGAFSRRLADLGARVLGFDFSAPFIECARERSDGYGDRIQYRVIDATKHEQLLGLGESQFEAAVCNMALMDMSDINVLAECLPRLLKLGARFVFSIMHPCFNNNAVRLSIEDEQQGVDFVCVPSVRVTKYLTPFASEGVGIVGQPVPQTYFHRPLQELLRPFLNNGMVLTGLEETAFEDASAARVPLSWDHFHEIPPVLAIRLEQRYSDITSQA